jgi:hypothetical protein
VLQAMRILGSSVIIAYLILSSIADAAPDMEAISKAVTDTTAIQFDLAVAHKRFSVMSQGMAEEQRCAARELLNASVVFWEVTEEAREVGRILGEMKSADDQNTALRHFGTSTHRAVAIGETDIQLVNESLASITTPEAIAEAKIIRDKMIEVRNLLKPFASEKW